MRCGCCGCEEKPKTVKKTAAKKVVKPAKKVAAKKPAVKKKK